MIKNDLRKNHYIPITLFSSLSLFFASMAAPAPITTVTKNPLRASVFTVPKIDELSDWDDDHLNEELEAVNKIARKHVNFSSMKRGDVVVFENIPGYRNDGKLIFDGVNLISLDYEPDEYGNVPSTFSITDFPSTQYWSDAIGHNCVVWIDPSKINDKDCEWEEIDEEFIKYNSDKGKMFIISISGFSIYTSSIEITLAKVRGHQPSSFEYSDSIEIINEAGDNVLYDMDELRKVFDV